MTNQTFTSFDGKKLHWEAYMPDSPKMVNLFLHGAFANASDAKFLAEKLLELDVATYAYDFRGWGHWPGKSGHITSRSEYIKDTHAFLEFIKAKHPDLPVMLSSHSMGSMVALRFLQDYQSEFVCATVSAPWLGTVAKVPPVLNFLAKILTVIWPTFADKATFTMEELSHDEEVIKHHYKEIENGMRKTYASTRWFVEMQKMQKESLEGSSNITIPIMMFQGGSDTLVDENLSKQAFESISSDDKHWVYFPDFYHEVFNEKDRALALNKAKDFVSKFIPS